MPKGIIVLAFLGAVLVGVTAQGFLPESPFGRTISFVIFAAAMFPLARHLWFRDIPHWRYWVGLLLGAMLAWGLDAWRTAYGLSEQSNVAIAVLVFGSVTAGMAFLVWKAARSRKR